MRSDNHQKRSWWSLWPLLVAIGFLAVRLGPEMRTASGARNVAFVFAFTLGLIAIAFYPYLFWKRRGVRRLARETGGRVWLVTDGVANRYLVLTQTTLGLVNRRNRGQTLPLDEIVDMAIGLVPMGTANIRWWRGLIVSFAEVAGEAQAFEVGFIRPIGFLVSTREAEHARSLISQARDADRTAASTGETL